MKGQKIKAMTFIGTGHSVYSLARLGIFQSFQNAKKKMYEKDFLSNQI
jgi:hypothetical protein